MKTTVGKLAVYGVALALLALLPLTRAPALSAGGLFSIGNLVFPIDRAATDTTFNGQTFPFGISIDGNQRVNDALTIDGNIVYNDPILRNYAYAKFTYRESYFSVGVGPSFGFFNSSSQLLRSGLTASVEVDWPGVAFISYDTNNTIGGALVSTGDYIQAENDISLGFYVPNAICSLNLLSRSYTAKTDAGSTVDDFREYSFKTDIFKKNVPYRIALSFAYQTLSKSFVVGATTTKQTLGSLVLGTRVEADVTNAITYVFDLTSSVYTFGQDALVGLSNPGTWPGTLLGNNLGYLFTLSTGVQINIDQLLHPVS